MSVVKLPYNKRTLEVEIPDKNLSAVLESKAGDYKTELTESEIVEKALDNPIGSPKLEELVKGKKNMVIISSDHTRPVPSKIIMPILLRRIRAVNPKIDIKILIATGFHRPTTHEELVNKFGEEIVKNENIIVHDSRDSSSLVKIGTLPSGGELIINKTAVEAELDCRGFYRITFLCGIFRRKKEYTSGHSFY